MFKYQYFSLPVRSASQRRSRACSFPIHRGSAQVGSKKLLAHFAKASQFIGDEHHAILLVGNKLRTQTHSGSFCQAHDMPDENISHPTRHHAARHQQEFERPVLLSTMEQSYADFAIETILVLQTRDQQSVVRRGTKSVEFVVRIGIAG